MEKTYWLGKASSPGSWRCRSITAFDGRYITSRDPPTASHHDVFGSTNAMGTESSTFPFIFSRTIFVHPVMALADRHERRHLMAGAQHAFAPNSTRRPSEWELFTITLDLRTQVQGQKADKVDLHIGVRYERSVHHAGLRRWPWEPKRRHEVRFQSHLDRH